MKAPITHAQAQSLIHKSLASALDRLEGALLEQHLAGCETCSAVLAEQRALDSRLTQALPRLYPAQAYSPAALDRKLEDIQVKMRKDSMKFTLFSMARMAGAALALALLVGGLYWLVSGMSPLPQGGAKVPPKLTATAAPTLTPTLGGGDRPGPNSRSGKTSLPDAEKLLRAWIFTQVPDMNPDAQFPMKEITTDEVWQRLGAQVFKVTDGPWQNEALMLFADGQVIEHLGSAFGGDGVTGLFALDLNSDGQPDLLFNYLYGSGQCLQSAGWIERTASGEILRAKIDLKSANEVPLLLKKTSDQRVEVYQVDKSSPESALTGSLEFKMGMLVFVSADAGQALYVDSALKLSFAYPAEWQPVSPRRSEGPGGFFELSAALLGDANRACEWEVNLHGASYGVDPLLVLININGLDFCAIQPRVSDSSGVTAGLFNSYFFQIDPTHYLKLDLSPASEKAILGSLRLSNPFTGIPDGPVTLNEPAGLPAPQLTTRAAAGLEVDEWSVAPAGEDTPTHIEFSQRIPAAVTERNASLRGEGPDAIYAQTRDVLKGFGYELPQAVPGPGWYLNQVQSNAQGTPQPVKVMLSMLTNFFPLSVVDDGQGNQNFAWVVENDQGLWLVTKDSLAPYDPLAHCNTRPVYAAPGRLITLDCAHPQKSNEAEILTVRQNGQPIFSYRAVPEITGEAVKGLFGYQGHWSLEVSGTLIVDGAVWNLKALPSPEIFAFSVLDGKPFFLYRRADGQVGASYDGSDLPEMYAAVVHDRCCEAAGFNPRSNAQMVWFYARRGGEWLYVEMLK